ncbi:methylmalonyl-CoA mutase [Streptomyces violarus]|uniref:methylmalonyl-CoA mutase n=1 Tax=Streptomyces violarus TaxID=67380 RepID=A0A7W4ZM43_9ACTN|nr:MULTISPECIES: methylmalonyl-CoA mutase family protein [Streptomyces]MBB3075010.1 methylmalonyl-CoA mutase [Streptomyces violarus]WRT97649.1 methylmalonyl-CoA mutase family protein [Streptomyces sp. CGMCC 4.1772]GHD01850.1 methylmalonyl-CoA mutase [Streptomyces violarus]
MTVLPDDGLELAGEFPDVPHEQWQRLVAGVLRKSGKDVEGAEAEEALSTALEDGLRTRPLYTARDGAPEPGFPGFAPFVRGGRAEGNTVGGWDVRQRHTAADGTAVLADLENGVSSLWLTVGEDGIPVPALGTVLDGVYLDLAPVVLDAGRETEPAARELLRLYEERGVARDVARGNLGADPLGHEARTGQGYDVAPVADLARRCAEEYPGLRALTVDALPYHEAGGSAAQELGCSLATAVAYLRELTDAGLSVEQACAQLEFRYAATADQFLTIAKLRAARRLWARVAEACGAPRAGAQLQHVVTSPVMMTRRDPWVNMLRTTIATLAAGAGGADSVTVLPFDHALGLPDAFARRIARNTSTILIEESHLSRVIDPAGGSWYVERLTDELAHAGWEFFRRIERLGGQAAALRSGDLGRDLADTWAARSGKLAKRREPITGVSEFPHIAEKPVIREPVPESRSGGLPRVRRDEAYEALRARSDAHLAATGTRPRIFLAAIGPAAAHTARLTFASNLFQAGGIEPVTEGTFEESGASEAVLCSSDALYEERAEAVAGQLKAAGAAQVFLAGRPGNHPGVDSYVFAGCDAVAVLSATLDRMGVS